MSHPPFLFVEATSADFYSKIGAWWFQGRWGRWGRWGQWGQWGSLSINSPASPASPVSPVSPVSPISLVHNRLNFFKTVRTIKTFKTITRSGITLWSRALFRTIKTIRTNKTITRSGISCGFGRWSSRLLALLSATILISLLSLNSLGRLTFLHPSTK